VVAKYGDKSVYFDLEDIGNTTGQWDLYGSDAPSPYNPLQVRFTGLLRHVLCLMITRSYFRAIINIALLN
jgi:hypothetical protein